MDAGHLHTEERARFDAWIAASTRHHGAYIRARAGMSLLDGLAAAKAQTNPTFARPTVVSRRAIWTGAGAAAAATLVGGLFWGVDAKRVQTFSTQAGEVRRLSFANGSELLMDSQSKVRSVVKHSLQQVSLDAGRVWFDTLQSAKTSLAVNAGELRLISDRASFSVAREGERIDLLVTEGAVQAWDSRQRGSERITFASGSEATLIKASLVRSVHLSPDALTRAQAWKTGHIALDGETVAEAVETFNKHNHLQIVVRSSAVSNEPLFGYFYLNDPISFTSAIEESFEVHVRRQGDYLILE